MATSDTYTVSLLHFDGADASTTFTDESGKTWTARGNAQLDTAQKKFGTASLLLDGTTDYIDTPDHDDFNFGSGDFTVDFWFRPAATPSNYDTWFGQWQSGTPSQEDVFKFDYGNAGELRWYSTSGNVDKGYYYTSSLHPLSANTWYHLAIVRNNSNFYIFKDGVSLALVEVTAISTNTLPDLTGTPTIGTDLVNAGRDVNGWIEEFRVSKGIARWTANFTPQEYPYDTPTINYLKKYRRLSFQ